MSNDTIILRPKNQVFFDVTCSHEQSYELRSYFEVYAENYKFHPRYRSNVWNGKISMFSILERTLPIGLLPLFIQYCTTFGYKYVIDCAPSFLKNLFTDEEYKAIKEEVMKDCKLEFRDYQEQGFRKLITNKRGVIEFATGSGKSLILYAVIKFIMSKVEKKILLVVTA